MASQEQIDNVVVKSMLELHLEDKEWVFNEDILSRARALTASEGYLGVTHEYKVGAFLLRLVRRPPGPFLESRRHVEFVGGHLGESLGRLLEAGKVEKRREPKDVPEIRRRKQFSLTTKHPLYRPRIEPYQ